MDNILFVLAELSSSFGSIIIAYVLLMFLFMYRRSLNGQRYERTFSLILNLDLTRPEIFSETDVATLSHRLIEQKMGSKELELYKASLRYLNKYEAICLGVSKGFYDEGLLKEYIGSTLVQAFRAYKPMIEVGRMRSNNPHIFSHLEAMARRWERGE